jgi:hypothetical protein
MTTRREFIRDSARLAGGALIAGTVGTRIGIAAQGAKSRVVSAAAEDMLAEGSYNPAAVHRAFAAGLTELTGQKTLAGAWASLVSPADVVGIKINCIGAPRVSSSLASIQETIAGLKGAGVKDNNIIVWDRSDRELARTGLAEIGRASCRERV